MNNEWVETSKNLFNRPVNIQFTIEDNFSKKENRQMKSQEPKSRCFFIFKSLFLPNKIAEAAK